MQNGRLSHHFSAWINRNRRLWKDPEATIKSARAFRLRGGRVETSERNHTGVAQSLMVLEDQGEFLNELMLKTTLTPTAPMEPA